ncbi:hypothetical protein B0O80DRAFT_446806 [Mortierella sp. GBAus27b]|nr:hypothetical protein B0O80DRAFT_446806 [Mortierella sp. GBAus27b]
MATNLSPKPTRDDVQEFLESLLDMETVDLGKLNIALYPKWARRILNDERCRRTRKGAQSQPTAKEKDKMISVVIKLPPATSVQDTDNHVDSGALPSHLAAYNAQDSGDKLTKKERKKMREEEEKKQKKAKRKEEEAKKKKEEARKERKRREREEKKRQEVMNRIVRPEVDGEYLHEALAQEASDYDVPFHLQYDRNLQGNARVRSDERSMSGSFTCEPCSLDLRRRHRWTSGVISTQLWLSVRDKRYCILINSQKCRRCERYVEPEVDLDKFVHKVIRAFTLWLGLREREEGWQDDHHDTPPHDQKRCRGCEKGVCKKGRGDRDY